MKTRIGSRDVSGESASVDVETSFCNHFAARLVIEGNAWKMAEAIFH